MQNKNQPIFWLIIIITLMVSTWGIIQIATPKSSGSTIVTDQEWINGNPEASVSLIEYSDFQCSACIIYYSNTKRLIEEFADDIQIIFRHYPLPSIHPQAELAAQAAEAAGQQNKFWEMHNMLFDNQQSWSGNSKAKDTFISYAQQLGLDIEKFTNDLEHKDIKNAIRDDKISGDQALIEGTPTFFLNGKKINNPRSYDKFRQLITTELTKIQ